MNEIKKINVGGVDYDIVSEPAEKKIAELEKNNTALASVIIGARDDLQNPVKVGLGQRPIDFDIAKDIFISKGASLSGESLILGSMSDCSLEMRWTYDNTFLIKGGFGPAEIKIGPDAIKFNGAVVGGSLGSGNAGIKGEVQIDSSSQLRMSSAAINIDDTNLILNYEGLHFGTQDGHIGNNVGIAMYGDAIELRQGYRSICRIFADACDIYIGSKTDDDRKGLIVREAGAHILEIGNDVYIGNNLTIGSGVSIGDLVHIGAKVSIGENLLDEEHLNIHGPVFLEAKTGETALTIGTGGIGYLKIDWGETDKIVFTNLLTGKKATLTLS